MPAQLRKLARLRRPNYVLPPITQTRRLYLLAVTVAYLTGVGLGESKMEEMGESAWLVLAGLTVVFIAVVGHLMRSARKYALFACDYSGIYLLYMDDDYVFVPWNKVRNITLDASVVHNSPILVVTAQIDDPDTAGYMAANYGIAADNDGGTHNPWGAGDVVMAVPFQAVSPNAVLNKIYKMRTDANPRG